MIEILMIVEAEADYRTASSLADRIEKATFLIEEPENNMHPAYERLFPELFADSIGLGHQILLTTHSEILVAALGNAVRLGRLSPEDVVIWHLDRSTGGVEAKKIRISEKGYLDEWVSSFAEVEEELYHEWSAGVPEKGDPSDR